MKNIKRFTLRYVLLAVLIILCISLNSCSLKYKLYYEDEKIVSIDILDVGLVTYEHTDIRACYSVSDIEAFLSDFYEMKYVVAHNKGRIDHNSRIVRITYDSGEYEFIDYGYALRFLASGRAGYDGAFEKEEFYALLEKYSPPPYSGEITEYEFLHPESEIETVEIVSAKYSYECTMPIEEINSQLVSDSAAFLDDLKEVECKTGGWAKWYDDLKDEKKIIKVTYKNEEYEYISSFGYLQFKQEYVAEANAGGRITQYLYLSGEDCKCFNEEQFSALIEKYSK